MVFALSIGLWILVRGGRRRLACAAAFSAVFLACALPWFMRNADAFGSPLYTQNGQFLLNENHWAAWEVRDTPPGPADMLRHQGPAAVVTAVFAGTLRVLEPLTTGTLHRGEVFGWPSMILFAVLSLVALGDPAMRRRMILPAFAALPTTASLVLHEHPGRYLTFLVVVVVCLGIASAARISERLGLGTKTRLAIAALAFLPLARPLHALAASDSRARASEAAAISRWISRNSEPDEWVVTFPNVELLIWDYRRPTLTMPDDYEALLWPCLQKHGVRFVVVDPDLPAARLAVHEMDDGAGRVGWERLDPPLPPRGPSERLRPHDCVRMVGDGSGGLHGGRQSAQGQLPGAASTLTDAAGLYGLGRIGPSVDNTEDSHGNGPADRLATVFQDAPSLSEELLPLSRDDQHHVGPGEARSLSEARQQLDLLVGHPSVRQYHAGHRAKNLDGLLAGRGDGKSLLSRAYGGSDLRNRPGLIPRLFAKSARSFSSDGSMAPSANIAPAIAPRSISGGMSDERANASTEAGLIFDAS